MYLIDTKILVQKKLNFKFIFCGSKKSNYNYIINKIKSKNLQDHIKVFDYLDDDNVISLYLNCLAVLVPPYVGRSSVPLIESFYFKKNIFYSYNILDKEIEQYVNTFDLKSPDDLANKIENFLASNKKNQKPEEAFSFFLKNFDKEKSNNIIFDILRISNI